MAEDQEFIRVISPNNKGGRGEREFLGKRL